MSLQYSSSKALKLTHYFGKYKIRDLKFVLVKQFFCSFHLGMKCLNRHGRKVTKQ